MSFSRIKAVWVEDSVETEDVLVVDLFVNTDGSARPMEIFGYAIDDGEKWPIYIKPKGKEGLLHWGAGGEDAKSTVNLFQRKIQIGEYITRIDTDGSGTSEYTYRITEVFDWSQLR